MKRLVILTSLALLTILAVCATPVEAQDKQKKNDEIPLTPLEEFLRQARQTNPMNQASGASLFTSTAPGLFLFVDVKARHVNDIVTIQILEAASATNTANTNTEKAGSASLAMPSFFGIESKAGSLDFARLLQSNSNVNFAGQGATTRSGQLQAWLSARVLEVLPNGDLVIEGTKDVTINRERQSLSIRGVVRQRDVTPSNIVLSTSIAHMEVKFDGKGIISDANKPGWLHWLFTKILPF